MGELENRIITELKQRLPAVARQRMQSMILFGSRARGDASENSDLDLIALVDSKSTELERIFDDTAYSVMWDHDFKPIISIKVFEEKHFNYFVTQGYSFYRNIMRDGLIV